MWDSNGKCTLASHIELFVGLSLCFRVCLYESIAFECCQSNLFARCLGSSCLSARSFRIEKPKLNGFWADLGKSGSGTLGRTCCVRLDIGSWSLFWSHVLISHLELGLANAWIDRFRARYWFCRGRTRMWLRRRNQDPLRQEYSSRAVLPALNLDPIIPISSIYLSSWFKQTCFFIKI